MLKSTFRATLAYAFILITGLLIFSGNALAKKTEKTGTGYEEAVSNLKELIRTTPSLKQHIEEALQIVPKGSYWYGKTSGDFVAFFDSWLVYNPLPEAPGKYIRPFDELANLDAGEILFDDNIFSSWFIEFVNARGDYLKTPASSATLGKWITYPDVHIDDYKVPEKGFGTFNDFFLRKLKPGVRPLGGKGDPSVIVSPADGSICEIYAKDLDSNFRVKRDVINIRQTLNNSPYAERFIGGKVFDILLWFTDYHHFHAPVSGKVVEIGEYSGSYNYDFAHVDWYRELAKHKRTCYIIDSEKFGLVAMIPVGFWGVGSIRSEVKTGDYIEKGQEIGHFGYGGSSILLVFEPGAVDISLPVPVRKSGDEGYPVKVRQKIGTAAK
ncbi:MAG: phosphatidylserine decarboxylase [Chlorobiales bacterium]|nr:phosphatidylserine decarboxylase [Chlorobiales bacterium]